MSFFERKNPAQNTRQNSVLIVSGFRPELVSGSETRTYSEGGGDCLTHAHTRTILPALPPSLPFCKSALYFALSLAPSLSLFVSFL